MSDLPRFCVVISQESPDRSARIYCRTRESADEVANETTLDWSRNGAQADATIYEWQLTEWTALTNVSVSGRSTKPRCRTDGCDGNPDSGDAYDGYCPSCADQKFGDED